MAKSVIADTALIAAFLDRRDNHHKWALLQAEELPIPWLVCEPVLTETFFVLEPKYGDALITWLQRGSLRIAFNLADELEPVLTLMKKYANVPMSLADACIVRMTEIVSDPIVLTTDSDFRVYRRHSRQVIPCRMP